MPVHRIRDAGGSKGFDAGYRSGPLHHALAGAKQNESIDRPEIARGGGDYV